MRLTFITDEMSQDPAIFTAVARRYGCTAVELRTVFGLPVVELPQPDIRRMTAYLAGQALETCCIASSVFKCPVSSDLGVEIEKLRRALAVAEVLSCRHIRIFSFRREGSRQTILPYVQEVLGRAAEIAGSSDVDLLVENGRGMMHATAHEVAETFAVLKAPKLGALWDPANCLSTETDAESVARDYVTAAPHVRHVHLKDLVVRPGEPATYVELGRGMLNIPRQLQALRDQRYEGFLSLEPHWRIDRALSPEQIQRPGGFAFSEGGEPAIRRCFDSLLNMTSECDRGSRL